ncbi:MAG: YicC family protein [Acidobacteriales bacterium]|nr:YicC family protein [Terriglobales bacterium]
MPIRSMTGFAQVKGQAEGQLGFMLSLKAVNHRFLDLHFRMPADTDGLEMKLRRVLKERVARGHVELTLTVERAGNTGFSLNRTIVSGYIEAYRAAAAEFGLLAEPDLNAILRIPGALDAGPAAMNGKLDGEVLSQLDVCLESLNRMREDEGTGIERELRLRMNQIRDAGEQIDAQRKNVQQAYVQRLSGRLQELIGNQVDPERVLQESALLVDRSDIEEELVRLKSHVEQFLGLLDQGGEVGKKMDFLLQELNREANTLLSKTSGLAGEALKITELGLAMKSDIEKAREQVQNVE